MNNNTINNKTPLYLFYHINYTNNNIINIINDQISLLRSTKLYDFVDKIYYSIVGNNNININFPNKFELIYKNSNIKHSDLPMINFIHKQSKRKKFNCLYVHTMGNNLSENNSIWRKYIEYYNINLWEKNIQIIEKYDIIGTSYVKSENSKLFDYYDGNFWWAQSKYLKTLTNIYKFDIDNFDENKTKMWLFSNKQKHKMYNWVDLQTTNYNIINILKTEQYKIKDNINTISQSVILRNYTNTPFDKVKTMVDNNLLPTNEKTIIVLGYNTINKYNEFNNNFKNKGKTIVYQLEQLYNNGSLWYNPKSELKWVIDRTNNIKKWLSNVDMIWDYDVNNIRFLEKEGFKNIIHKPMIYDNELKRITNNNKKHIDILFYGAINYKRAKILSQIPDKYKLSIIGDYSELSDKDIQKFNLNEKIINKGDYSNNLDDTISQSKVILSTHYYDSNLQEQVRIFDLIINNKCVLTEKSMKNYFGDLIVEFDNNNDMISKISKLIDNKEYMNYINISDRFKKKDFKKYRVGVSYNTFYGLEYLKRSIESLRGVIDYVVVVHQRVSFSGEIENKDNDKLLKFLLDNNYVDDIIYYEHDKDIDVRKSVISKRNIGLDKCRENHCDYIITADTDECYDSDKLKVSIDNMYNNNIDTLYSPILSYYYNDSFYFEDTFYVPSVYKIDKRKYKVGLKSTVLCDPVRKMDENKYKISKNTYMHHYTYLKESFSSKEKSKMINRHSTNYKQYSKILKHLNTWKIGDNALVFTNNMEKGGLVELKLIPLKKVNIDNLL